jgi:hypothetical protein
MQGHTQQKKDKRDSLLPGREPDHIRELHAPPGHGTYNPEL